MSVNDPSPAAAGKPSASIGPYRIVERIGAGGMGEVYKALGPDGRELAVKLVRRATLAASPGLEARFHREAMVSANINHPAIVKVYDVGESPHGLYMAMDYVSGRGLDSMVKAGALDVEQALDIAAQVADALAVAHDMSVIHRDIKPGNIIIEASGRARLLDFGIARMDTESGNLTKTGHILGTPAYMAPEQLTGNGKNIDARVDVYALGVVLYEMLVGGSPFSGENVYQLLDAITSADIPPPSKRRPGVPIAVDRVVKKAMARDLERRYESATAFNADLVELSESGALSRGAAPSPGRGSGRARPDSRAQPRPRLVRARKPGGQPALMATGLAIVALLATIAVLSGSRSEPEPPPSSIATREPPRPPPAVPGSGSSSPALSPADELERDITRLEAERDSSPAGLVRRAAAWRALESRAENTRSAERVATGIVGADQKLEQAARAAFDRIKIQADALAEDGRYDAAIDAWSKYDPAFSAEAWRERVLEERSAIETARRRAETPEPTPPEPTPPEPPPEPPTQPDPPPLHPPVQPDPPTTAVGERPAMVPAGWRVADVTKHVHGFQNAGEPWLSRGGVFELSAPAGAGRPALAGWVERTDRDFKKLRNVYLEYDIFLEKGAMEVRVMSAVNGPPMRTCVIVLNGPETPARLVTGRWCRMRLLYRDGTMRYELEGASPPEAAAATFGGIETREGALLFGARPDSTLRLRPVAMWIGESGGRLDDEGSQPAPEPDKPPGADGRPGMVPEGWRPLSIPANLHGFIDRGAEWLPRDGVYELRGGADGVAHAGLVHKLGPGDLRRFKNVYVEIDFLLVRGAMEILVLSAINNQAPQRCIALVLNGTENPAFIAAGVWHRLRLVYQDRSVRYRLEGPGGKLLEASSAANLEAEQGALSFGARAGAELRVRPVAVWVGAAGDPLDR